MHLTRLTVFFNRGKTRMKKDWREAIEISWWDRV